LRFADACERPLKAFQACYRFQLVFCHSVYLSIDGSIAYWGERGIGSGELRKTWE
jgi:hypothetical protein